MRVTSPVGDFPYAVDRIAVEGRRLVAYGRMGAWPSRVELGPEDARDLGRAAWRPLVVAGMAVLGAVAWRRLRKEPVGPGR
ncbi:MAG TPA: hypothetical protein VE777_18470 [Gaiellales bacterium]|jgi:hypothetical protein|nr:hypothetical protein [Gaiellales bacterium]